MNNIMTIVKKELKRFFGDKRLFFTTVLMPGLMIYIIYTLMGTFMTDKLTADEEHSYQVVARNLPASVSEVFQEAEITCLDAMSEEDFYLDQIRNKELDLYMSFPENFDEAVASYEISSGEMAPQISMYYLSTEANSDSIYRIALSLLDAYEMSMSNKFDINGDMEKQYDLASEEDITGMIVSMMMPMLMLTFLFAGCTAVAPESIAGEKERGTIATLLVTPMKRSQLAIGKIISLSMIALLCGISSFIGTMLSLPAMMNMAGEFNMSIYKPGDFVCLLLILLTTVLIMIAAVSMISANAKSVKEANSTIGPLTILIMVIGLSGMFGSGVAENRVAYLIPLYNSVQCISAIFSFKLDMINVLISVASNLVYAVALIFGLTKMFENEKVMFS